MTDAGKHRAADWRPQELLGAAELSSSLAGLLSAKGSLTERLRATCRRGFGVRLLQQEACHTTDYPEHELDNWAGKALLREVYLLCDEQPVVFAQTLVPRATLDVHPWLAELGGQPLGHALFARDDVSRQPFEFARLDVTHSLVTRALCALDTAPETCGRLWGRRSLFLVAGLPVSVNEVFFPSAARHAG